MIKQVPCRNRVTGATAELPETALRHLPNWLPIAENPADEQADDAADTAASDAADTAASDTEAERPAAPAGPARKRKAAAAAKTEKE